MSARFPAWARLWVALGLATGGTLAWFDAQREVALVVWGLAALMGLSWFRYHDVLRAERAYNTRDRDQAWTYLDSVPFGGRLLAGRVRAYYHHLRSRCLLHREQWADAVREAEAGLRVSASGSDAPGSHLAAAQAYVHLGDADAARRHAESARRLPHNDAIDKGLARLERALEG